VGAAFSVNPCVGFDSYWHSQCTQKAGEQFGFPEDAWKIMQLVTDDNIANLPRPAFCPRGIGEPQDQENAQEQHCRNAGNFQHATLRRGAALDKNLL
jgi:hypothetical protein